MKSFRHRVARGFTLVELLVVIAIIGVMLSLAANVLQNPGKDKNVTSGVQILQGMIQEARATAIGNDTYARVVIACDEDNSSKDSVHLRYVTVQKYQRDPNENLTYDGTDTVRRGEWVSTSSGTFFPNGVYFSPTYSSELMWMPGATGTELQKDSARLSGHGQATVYYIEFDEKGRFVTPDTRPGENSCARRLVVIAGTRSNRNGNVDGIVPSRVDAEGRPAEARGLVLWPSGNTSVMKTTEQIYDPSVYKSAVAEKAKTRKKQRDKNEKAAEAKRGKTKNNGGNKKSEKKDKKNKK